MRRVGPALAALRYLLHGFKMILQAELGRQWLVGSGLGQHIKAIRGRTCVFLQQAHQLNGGGFDGDGGSRSSGVSSKGCWASLCFYRNLACVTGIRSFS